MHHLLHIGFIQNLRPWEIALILIVFLLLFGAKRLPDLARGIGKSIREFKKATSEAEQTFRSALDEEEKAATTGTTEPKTKPAAKPEQTDSV